MSRRSVLLAVSLLIPLAGCIDREAAQPLAATPLPPPPDAEGGVFSSTVFRTFYTGPDGEVQVPELEDLAPLEVAYQGLSTVRDEWGRPVVAHNLSLRVLVPTEPVADGRERVPESVYFERSTHRPLGSAWWDPVEPLRVHAQDLGIGPWRNHIHAGVFVLFATALFDDRSEPVTAGDWTYRLVPDDAPPLTSAADCTQYRVEVEPRPPYPAAVRACLDEGPVPLAAQVEYPDGSRSLAVWEGGDFVHPVRVGGPPPAPAPAEPAPWLEAGGTVTALAPPMGRVGPVVEPAQAMVEAMSLLPSYVQQVGAMDGPYLSSFSWSRDLEDGQFPLPPGGVGRNVGMVFAFVADGSSTSYYDSLVEMDGNETAAVFLPVPPGQPVAVPPPPPASELPDALVPFHEAVGPYAFHHPPQPNWFFWRVEDSTVPVTWPGRAWWAMAECFPADEPALIASAVNGQLLVETWTEEQENGACSMRSRHEVPPVPSADGAATAGPGRDVLLSLPT